MTNNEAIVGLQVAADIAIETGCKLAKMPVMTALAIMDLLKEQEPVVRCKDCKHGEVYTNINGVLLSMMCDGVVRKPDWFCAKGEREDDDD